MLLRSCIFSRQNYPFTLYVMLNMGCKMRCQHPVIGFTEKDARRLHHPHDDALMVNICVRDYNTHRVLVDNGSFVDILYYSAFQQMRIKREQLIPTNAPLIGFGGTMVHPLRAVTLPVTVGDYLRQITKDIMFLVIDCSFCLQCHIGLPYFEFMEGRNFNLPFDDQVPHQIWIGRGKRRSAGSVGMLHFHARNGRSFADYVYRRTADSGKTSGKIGRSTP